MKANLPQRLVVCGAAFLAPLVCAQSAYTLTDLGVPSGFVHSIALGVNATGQVTGVALDSNGNVGHAFLYSAGQMTDLGVPAGSTVTIANAINRAGQIVGGAGSLESGSARAFRYASGVFTDLGTLGGNYSFAIGINTTGDVVGESAPGAGGLFGFHAFLYSNGRMTDLGTLGGGLSSATCINDSGQIAGRAETSGSFNPVHAFLYASGRMTDLGTLGGSDSWALGINASGQVVGSSYLGSTGSPVPIYDQHAFLYSNGRMTDLGTLPPFGSSEAISINASGQVVGSVFDLYDGNDWDSLGQHAFLYTGGRMVDLNNQLIGSPGWKLLQATGINDSGAIVGFGLTPTGVRHAFLLTPSAEPLPLAVRTPPVGQHLSAGMQLALNVSASGTNLTYQWKKDGVAIPGATGPGFNVPAASNADMGFYTVVVSSGGSSTESPAAIVTVSTPAMAGYTFTTVAGTAGRTGTVDGSGSEARFFQTNALTLDHNGTVYIADFGTVRKMTAQGVVTTLAGSGNNFGTADGTGSAARFNALSALALDGSGNIFVADSANANIRKITAEGVVTTLAGSMLGPIGSGSADGVGTAARFSSPSGIAVDRNGNVFVADTGNHTIRKITPGGVVSTFAGATGISGFANGSATAARFSYPFGLAFDASGNLWVADRGNQSIRKITPDGVVTTVAGVAGSEGSADGPGSAARFNNPVGIAVNDAGIAYVADRDNHTIRRIATNGVVDTLGGAPGIRGANDGTGIAARFNLPWGIAVDSNGALFVGDTLNHTIRKGVPASAPVISRLANLSTRGFVPAGGELTVGFVIRGTGSKSLLVRGVGPTLSSFGVSGALVDPKLELIPAGASAVANANDDWGGGATLADAFAGVGAFALPATSKDAALVATMNVGGYSARITSGVAGGSGTAIAEVYDRDAANAASRLVNLSTLGQVGTGAQVLSTGFVIGGTEPKQVLVRVVGPGLASFGVAGAVADPQFTITPLGQSFTVAANDNWDGSVALTGAFAQAGAFALTPGSKDAALVVRLPPGGYTVQVGGNASGTALVEIYDLEP